MDPSDETGPIVESHKQITLLLFTLLYLKKYYDIQVLASPLLFEIAP